eukprot:TRINITY_DN20541_c0_g1_i1.p1 TRINITY_DN20541_c0_g1~~TRINITY_DN20541_c0_g1_i1.p1  ORF type:complete len:885 (-),score=150.59 TRINITY_DN20541_c0_g1_i1:111-2765(-)
MALLPMLSDKGLARFRTKRCERMIATGICTFGDRCQYSHQQEWLRRNPTKSLYLPELCPDAARCGKGASCSLAHSEEEVSFHPRRYKRSLCPRFAECKQYYCPLAHSHSELRHLGDGEDADSPRNATSGSEKLSGSDSKSSDESGQWCRVDEKLSIEKSAMAAFHGRVGSEALNGVRIVAGLLRSKGESEQTRCCVRIMPAGRGEREEAATVLRELRLWMALPNPPALPPDAAPRAIALRRTVASVYLVLPQVSRQPLGQCRPSLFEGRSIDAVASLARPGLRGLVEELQQLHSNGIAHLCICPGAVFVESLPAGHMLRLGDFLGKIRSLAYMKSGGFAHPRKGLKDDAEDSLDPVYEAWAMWQPPELHKQLVAADKLDHFKIDAWQLGVTAFFMLTGQHPYGHHLEHVTRNIASGNAVNLPSLSNCLPQFADLILKLLCNKPEERLAVTDLLSHPALQSCDHAEQLSSQFSSAGKLPCPPGLFPPTDEAQLKSPRTNELESLEPGMVLCCIWEGGVRCRYCRKRSAKSEHSVQAGDEVCVLERAGGWVRSWGGWLPLYGIGDAEGTPLFKVARPPWPTIGSEGPQTAKERKDTAVPEESVSTISTPPRLGSAPPTVLTPEPLLASADSRTCLRLHAFLPAETTVASASECNMLTKPVAQDLEAPPGLLTPAIVGSCMTPELAEPDLGSFAWTPHTNFERAEEQRAWVDCWNASFQAGVQAFVLQAHEQCWQQWQRNEWHDQWQLQPCAADEELGLFPDAFPTEGFFHAGETAHGALHDHPEIRQRRSLSPLSILLRQRVPEARQSNEIFPQKVLCSPLVELGEGIGGSTCSTSPTESTSPHVQLPPCDEPARVWFQDDAVEASLFASNPGRTLLTGQPLDARR